MSGRYTYNIDHTYRQSCVGTNVEGEERAHHHKHDARSEEPVVNRHGSEDQACSERDERGLQGATAGETLHTMRRGVPMLDLV